MLTVQRFVHDAVSDAVRRRFQLSPIPAFPVEVPPTRSLGDLAVPVAFQLARPLRKAPGAIARELVVELGEMQGVAKVIAAPNGYLNFFLDRPQFLTQHLAPEAPQVPTAVPEKTIVEHTAINPNKAAHVGHLRNAALGDTLVRVLRFSGATVEVQNYIDDTGVQVADVIVGFKELEQQTLDEVRRIADTTRFDHFCWDLYSRVTDWYEQDRGRLEIRAKTLHELEHGTQPTAAMGQFIVDRIVRAHLATMARLNISYDLLTYEGDILRLHFWSKAFEILRSKRAVFLQTEGRLAGCWVMRIDDGTVPGDDNEEETREKVIVRSNGVVTYVGKDIANQFWKFGLLGLDFHYRRFRPQGDRPGLWTTTSTGGEDDAPSFGHAQRIYNVIDSRQMYLQALLSQALRVLGHPREADHSVHFSYEMVALSHNTAHELGYELETSERAKPFVEVSGRKGLGVKIDDLIDVLASKASMEVSKRNPGLTAGECERTAAQIATAAIRYFMLKYSRGKLIVFDMEEALSFEGETGPYLQYAAVRAGNILHKLRERDGLSESEIIRSLTTTSSDELTSLDETDPHGLWALVLEASRLDETVADVERTLEFSGLAKYAFTLAQVFNGFYHRYPVLNEERDDRKRWRAAGVAYFRSQFTRTLDLMGIEVPVRM